MTDRPSAIAGRFYPKDPSDLNALLDSYLDTDLPKRNAYGVMCPHAGYMYSGMVTGRCLSEVNIPDTVVIMCPNHTGLGKPFSVWPDGHWQTPLGSVPVDVVFTQKLLSNSSLFQADCSPHVMEHAIEVMVPFLQRLNPNVSIVPIVVRYTNNQTYADLGHALAETIKQCGGVSKVMMLGSSDMTHYESHESATRKDRIALDEIEKMDYVGLQEKLTANRITMCGDAGVSVMIAAARELGADHAETVMYRTSGDACGDYSSVVGYAAVIIPNDIHSEPVKLAYDTVNAFIKTGKIIDAPSDPTLGGIKSAGCFVSIHEHGELRGCIGTIMPTQPSIALEIIHNAISASTRDPRFEPISESELPYLDINVDILTPPEPIESESELDVKRYGCIVECRGRRGLLLPDLEGVDTVEQQIDICRRKGGIGHTEPVQLYRFEVKRYK